jgi:phenylacetic acid degradation operon negative regulatory protein
MQDISKSNDWLAFLFYALDLIVSPTPKKILQTFGEWDYQNRLRPQLKRLERARIIERDGKGRSVPYRFTARGRLVAHGGVDPVERWQRSWDGRWRLLIFDLPARERQLRLQLWRWLRSQRFGYLQNSVWISPDPVDEAHFPLKHLKLKPETVTILESRPVPPDSDASLVTGSWDLGLINRHYQDALDQAERGLELAQNPSAKSAQLRQWLAAERETWSAAITTDPLLPTSLLPTDYLGIKAWRRRQAVFGSLAERLMAMAHKV